MGILETRYDRHIEDRLVFQHGMPKLWEDENLRTSKSETGWAVD